MAYLPKSTLCNLLPCLSVIEENAVPWPHKYDPTHLESSKARPAPPYACRRKHRPGRPGVCPRLGPSPTVPPGPGGSLLRTQCLQICEIRAGTTAKTAPPGWPRGALWGPDAQGPPAPAQHSQCHCPRGPGTRPPPEAFLPTPPPAPGCEMRPLGASLLLASGHLLLQGPCSLRAGLWGERGSSPGSQGLWGCLSGVALPTAQAGKLRLGLFKWPAPRWWGLERPPPLKIPCPSRPASKSRSPGAGLGCQLPLPGLQAPPHPSFSPAGFAPGHPSLGLRARPGPASWADPGVGEGGQKGGGVTSRAGGLPLRS